MGGALVIDIIIGFLVTTVTGFQAVAGGAGIAKGLAEDIPIAGQAIAIGATALDRVSTGLEVAKCYP